MFPNQYTKQSLLGRNSFIKNVNWSSILDNTQKTLGVINQAIPIIYQVKPIISNARTMFRIADEMRFTDATNSTNTVVENKTTDNSNKPVFYI